jgi:Spy/CpxP family protein refolding chaperone
MRRGEPMTKLVVIIGFCVAFAAGLTVGLSRRANVEQPLMPAAPTTRSHRGSSFLATELNLSKEQQEQLKQIWEAARGGRGEHDNRRQELRDKRDADIEALLPAEQKAKYEQAMADYRAGLDAMDREVRDRFRKSVEETKKVLTPEQRAKYEEILSRHSPGGSGRDWGRDRDRSTTTRRSDAATRPTAL